MLVLLLAGVDKNPNCPPKFAGPSVTCGKAADPNLPCDAQDTCKRRFSCMFVTAALPVGGQLWMRHLLYW
jgi:hypothetical protein